MRIRRTMVMVFVILCALAGSPPLAAQGLEWVKANYTKHEYYIPMRDGVRLFTAVFTPKDRSQEYPMMLKRTPYSIAPYGEDRYPKSLGPSELMARERYIFAYQDVRGRWMSEGTYEHVRPYKAIKNGPRDIDESTDTYDTIEWLLSNVPGKNGRVGMWGISYSGFYAAMGLPDAHPALKAVSPQAPVTDWFEADDWHHNGAFLLAHAFRWFVSAGYAFTKPTAKPPQPGFDFGTEDGYEFFLRAGPLSRLTDEYFKQEIPFWDELMKHGTRDEFWKARDLRASLKKVRPAVMTVGGWFDAENLFGALGVYRSIEAQNPSAYNILVMGPWIHGGWESNDGDHLGDVRFDDKTSGFYRANIELPFFNHFLKDKGDGALPEAYMFETGTNQWRKFDVWPPQPTETRSLYLHAGGKLSFEPPTSDGREDFDEYISDPQKPVPLVPYVAPGMPVEYMVDDQRMAGRRPDVLVYQTDALEEDITLAGPITPNLHVSTTGTDCDWIVKLIDVYPDRFPDKEGKTDNTLGGTQQLVRGEILRGKFRNSLEKPEPFEPGKPTKVEFTVSDVFHTFRRGHRIMVQIQSTWYPFADINPGKFMDIYQATEADFQKTTQRAYHSKSLPSQLKVGVLPPSTD